MKSTVFACIYMHKRMVLVYMCIYIRIKSTVVTYIYMYKSMVVVYMCINLLYKETTE